MSTRVNPTFLLKGINPNKILADYQAGLYFRSSKPKSHIKQSKNTSILAPVYGTSNKDPIFAVKDRNNTDIIIATTNQSNYEVYTKLGGSLPEGGRCQRCSKDFKHTAIGYPVAFQEQTILIGHGLEAKYRIIYVFWTEGIFHSCECALAYLNLLLAQPADYRNTSYRDSVRWLRMMHKLMYPDAGVLRESQDPQLMKSNGGSIPDEEWNANTHIYKRTDRLLLIPAKTEYVRQNVTDPVASISYLEIIA